MRRRAGRWLLGVLLVGLVLWAATTGAVVWAAGAALEAHLGGRSLEAPVDAVVVLGGGLAEGGGLGPASRRRVAAAVAVHRTGKAGALIVSGGPMSGVGVPVGALMREHALRLGAPSEDVLVEDRADSTLENLRFAFAIADRHGMERLAIVSDAYHLPRAGVLAGVLGRPGIGLVAAAGPARAEGLNAAWPLLREALAWWHNLGRVAVGRGLDTLGQTPARPGVPVG